jgi:hypothetical protein
MVNAGANEGTGSSGGFLVPEIWLQGALDQSLEKEIVRPNSLVLPMTSSVLNVPGFDSQDQTGTKRGGLQLPLSCLTSKRGSKHKMYKSCCPALDARAKAKAMRAKPSPTRK